MSSSDTATPFPYTFDEFLKLCLITFNHAVKAYRNRSVVSFSRNPRHKNVWDVGFSKDETSLEKFPAGTSEEFKRAFRKWNLCDHFCLFLYRFLKHFAEHYGYTVNWADVRPRPKYTFLSGDMDEEEAQQLLGELHHSIFIIRTREGRTIVFDGTPEQFGWGEKSSIMDKESYWDQHVVGDGDEWYDLGRTEDQSDAKLRRDYGEYWMDVFKELRDMLDAVIWDEVVKLEPAERKQVFREESESRAFAVAARFWR